MALRREIPKSPRKRSLFTSSVPEAEDAHGSTEGKNHLDFKAPSQGCSKSSFLCCELRGHFILSELHWQLSRSKHGNNRNTNVSLGKGRSLRTHSTSGLGLATNQDFSGDINFSNHMAHKENPARNVCSGLFTQNHCTRGSASDRKDVQSWETGNTLGKEEDALHLSEFVCTQLQSHDSGSCLGNPGLVRVERIKAQQNQDRPIHRLRSSSISKGAKAQTGTLFLISV